MNEYENLKKAMYSYRERNEDLLQEAADNGDYKETEKRERRVKAINECIKIMREAR